MSFIAIGGTLAGGVLGGTIAGGTILGGAALGLGVGSMINSTVQSNKMVSAEKDALSQQQALVGSLKYQPIDIAKLQSDAAAQAVTNATQSLALERALQPAVAGVRTDLASTVLSDLQKGGNLSPDIMNQVAKASRTLGALSGAPAGPLTAASIGQTAESLKQQRLTNASNLMSQNALPVAGLDPGSLASAEVAQNTAQNQFNMAKAGLNSNLINSGAQVAGSQAGAQAGQTSSILNLVSSLMNKPAATAAGTTASSSLPATPALFNYQLNSGGLNPGGFDATQILPIS